MNCNTDHTLSESLIKPAKTMSSDNMAEEENLRLTIALVNRLLEPKPRIKCLTELKDGKHLCHLIVMKEWNRLLSEDQLIRRLTLDDIDWQLIKSRIPHKMYSVIEKFIKKYFGFDYIISDHFKSGDQKAIYEISVLVLNTLVPNNSPLIEPVTKQMSDELAIIAEESKSILKSLRQRLDPFRDITAHFDQIIGDLINNESNGSHRCIKSFRLSELQQVFKLFRLTNRINIDNTSSQSRQISDRQLMTTIRLIVNYSQLSEFCQKLKNDLNGIRNR